MHQGNDDGDDGIRNISSVTYLKSNVQLSNLYFFIRSIILETCIEKSLNKKNQSVYELIAF